MAEEPGIWVEVLETREVLGSRCWGCCSLCRNRRRIFELDSPSIGAWVRLSLLLKMRLFGEAYNVTPQVACHAGKVGIELDMKSSCEPENGELNARESPNETRQRRPAGGP